jgi:dihydroxyacetone kinase-like protein
VKLDSADAIADEMLGAILGDLGVKAGSEVLLLVNGFGATPLMELYLMVNSAHRMLANHGIQVSRHLTGSYVTSLDMAGCSITVYAYWTTHCVSCGMLRYIPRHCDGRYKVHN